LKIKLLVGAAALIAALAFVFLQTRTEPPPANALTAFETYREGLHYRTVSDSQPVSGSKVQVQEFFWYGCPHCRSFEPAVREYKQTLTADTELVQIPVTWNEATSLHGAIYYVALELDAPDQLHDDLFDAFIELRKEGNLDKHVQEAQALFAVHGFEINDLANRVTSSPIQSKLKSAEELMRLAKITGTPSLMVDSKWVLENNEEVSIAGVFNVLNFLVDKARSVRQ